MLRNRIDKDRFPFLWLLYQRELAFRHRMEQLAEIYVITLPFVCMALIKWIDATEFTVLGNREYFMAPIIVFIGMPFFLAWIKADIRKKMLARLRAIEEAAKLAENRSAAT